MKKVEITLAVQMTAALTFHILEDQRKEMSSEDFEAACDDAVVGWQRSFDRSGGHDAGAACLYGTIDSYDSKTAMEKAVGG